MCLAAVPPPFVQCGPGCTGHKTAFSFPWEKGEGGRGSVNEKMFSTFLNSALLILKDV